ncbi:MAG TPA: hypothetical protein VFQ59_00565 [Candidatus Paceibacterota bacterium]|nr:hypothetical protein [Candidatus Paceibacterota bacterium]
MEKFPSNNKRNIGKNIRNIAGGIGVSALAFFAEKALEGSEINVSNNKNNIENKIEWERNELEFQEGSMENMAFNLAKKEIRYEEDFRSHMERIQYLEKLIREYVAEIDYRESNGKPSDKYVQKTTEELRIAIGDNEKLISLCQVMIDQLAKKKEILPELVKEKIKEIKKKIFFYDIGRQWVLDNMKNPEYSNRLKEEYRSDILTGNELKEYLELARSYRIHKASDGNFVISQNITESHGNSAGNVEAFFDASTQTVFFPLDIDSVNAVNYAIHEYAHKITTGNIFLSSKAISLFKDAFNSLSMLENVDSNANILKIISYYSDPTEMYARKKVFEHDLEVLGVKKYEEQFTKEHYLKALQLEKEGKLNNDSREFLLIIKPNMIEKVMNEIADADFNEKEVEGMV